MFQISHKEKILWSVRCTYHSIPGEVCYVPVYNGYDYIDSKIKYYKRSKEQLDYLYRAYFYCTQIDKVYYGSFKEFEEYVQRTYNPYSKYYRKSFNWQNKHLRRNKYQRKSYHEKKILSERELAKRDWREKKQFRRDKANKHYTRGPKKFYKKIANREHRQWVRQNIRHGRWDMNDKDYKIFCDPWRYD